jgi:hypothetical protein
MRVVKFVRPPSPDDQVFQVEGELVKRFNPKTKLERPLYMPNVSRFISPSSMKILEETYPSLKEPSAPSKLK